MEFDDDARLDTSQIDDARGRGGAGPDLGGLPGGFGTGAKLGGGGLIGMLITAAVKQIINSSTDAGFPIAGVASNRLLSAGHPAGLLYGPRSPKYGTD